MVSILNFSWPLPLCGLHLAVVERLVYSIVYYAGGDLYPWQVELSRTGQRRGGRQSIHYDYLTEMVAILKMVAILNF